MNVSIYFGALTKSIAKQLDEQGLSAPRQDVSRWQRDADAICRLAVAELLPAAQIKAARQRLVKNIARVARREP